MKLAILGSTGAVGEEVLDVLDKKQLPIEDLVLLASPNSAGKELPTYLGGRVVQAVSAEALAGCQYAIFSAGSAASKEWAPVAQEQNCTVIDNSSAFRYDENIPLVIPEINGDAALNAPLIANPNCTTAIGAMALHPLHREFGLKKIIMSTYQSASGAGARGMDELQQQQSNMVDGSACTPGVFPHQLAGNVIPRIDAMQANGYTKEEMKVAWETRKIFDDESLNISCTAVRVPVERAHSESIVVETSTEITAETARQVLEGAPGVELRDDPGQDVYPMPLTASGKWDIEVGRIRQNLAFGNHGLEFFVSGDQLLKGAALNAVQILEHLLNNR